VPLAGGAEQFIGCFAAGANFTIDLSAFSWSASTEWSIHIFDSTATPDPTLDIGEVTIANEAAGVTALAVHVSGPTQPWRFSPEQALTAGCVDLAGVTITDSDTLGITQVSIAIGGDLGSLGIHANQIVRIQANGTDQGGGVVTGGHIAGNIIGNL